MTLHFQAGQAATGGARPTYVTHSHLSQSPDLSTPAQEIVLDWPGGSGVATLSGNFQQAGGVRTGLTIIWTPAALTEAQMRAGVSQEVPKPVLQANGPGSFRFYAGRGTLTVSAFGPDGLSWSINADIAGV